MPNEFLTKFKTILLDEKESLEAQIKGNEEDGYLDGNVRDSTGELSLYDNHPADSGTELFERSKNLAMDEHHEDQLEKINLALDAIQDGSYGRCRECGNKIPEERLEAIPYTLYCLDHTPEQTISDDRPAEEEVLEQTHTTGFQRRQNSEMADNEDSFQDVAQFGTSETPADVNGDHDNYQDLYDEGNENKGFTEEYESFSANDIEGDDRVVVPNKQKEDYEEMLDDSGLESQLGDIPYKNKDSYIQDKASDND
ncbi:TraR/DksA C4-type zinc finger protein [Mesobacillus foraminis]|uniref:TraR/DksA family transcriptional regulator n=1 Tax=Mesobacillus foraminis TaxID=279826 RepID=A0A4R2BEK9_9BACI|nr:TraR/DksA C4-type zinc finger protein [Mesobacillus foraminis]TCN24329.1 TraR/DksA family transcriptional regulator [Mesobacillus foraminis]